MKPGSIFLICFWLTVIISGHAQPGQLLFHHLRIQDGLSQADNAFVTKDSRGFVWISSVTGLNRFDGTGVKVYAPNVNDPRAVRGENVQSSFFEDEDGDLWFTTYDALNVYNWSEDCFEDYQASLLGNIKIGYHIFHRDEKHNLWLLVQDSLILTFNLDDLTFSLVANIHQSANRALAFEDRQGRVGQIFTYSKGGEHIKRILLDNKQLVIEQDFFLPDPSLKDCRKLIPEGDSILWILSSNSLFQYPLSGRNQKLIPLPMTDAVSFDWLDSVTFIIGTAKNGLFEFDIEKEKIVHQYLHQRQNALSPLSNAIEYINRDKDGVVWIGSKGIGISYAKKQKKKFTTHFIEPGTQENNDFIPLELFPQKDNRILCPTALDGFFELQKTPQSIKLEPVVSLGYDDLPGEVFSVFSDKSDNIWVSTHGGLGVINPSLRECQKVASDETLYYTGISDANSRIFISGFSRGVFHTTGNWKDGYAVQKYEGIPDTAQYLIIGLDSKGQLWIMDNLQQIVVYDTLDSNLLAALPITGIGYEMLQVPGEPIAWITSTSGLYKVNIETLQIERIYNQDNRMPSSWFRAMEMDAEGRLWIVYNQGILRFDPKTEICRAYTVDDGLSQMEYATASCRLSNGEMWFGAVNAITYFSPADIKDDETPAFCQVSEIQVNDRVPTNLVCELSGARNPTEIRKLTFNYLNNTLSFKVHSLDYSAPAHNRVQYQLKGLDDHVLETKSGSVIRYSNLRHGEYELILRAINADSAISPDAHVLYLKIKPPFYRTWWFYVLVTLLICSIAGYIIYLRFTKALQLQRVRFKLYENLHDDVGSRLTAIVLTAEELENRYSFDHPKLTTISQIAKSIVGNMRRLVWAIDPENDKMNNVIQKITHDKSLMLSDDIAFQVEADEATRNVTVPGELRYQISSICNEALNNISKYAKATRVTLRLKALHNKIHLTIEDNGIGFNVDEKAKNAMTGSGYGLNNMKRRASRVKGTLDVYSAPGQGTRIEGMFPL